MIESDILEAHTAFLNNLKARLFSTLNQLDIAEHCVLLDSPLHLNAGDHLITSGTFAWIDETGRKILHCCAKQHYNKQVLEKVLRNHANATILLQGGGNLGGLWAANDKFRKEVIADFPNQKIVLLPQTIFFTSNETRAAIAASYSRHEQLTVLCRDQVSFELASDSFLNATLKLVPDMALALGTSLLAPVGSRQTLALMRTDHEKIDRPIATLADMGLEVNDWTSFSEPPLHKFLRRAGKLLQLPTHIDGGYRIRAYSEKLTGSAIQQLSGRSALITDRLHGHVLAMLMGIPHALLDNKYHKNRSTFETWSKNCPSGRFVEDGKLENAMHLLAKLQS